jgi:hydroxyisourate hydrolase
MAQASTLKKRSKPMITTHVLDLARGTPAQRIPVQLDFFITGQGWREVGQGLTSEDGHLMDFGAPPMEGVYRMSFDVAAYMPHSFYPTIAITFEVRNPLDRYHLPLLLSPFGYSTYRAD